MDDRRPGLEYHGQAPEGLVGNGRSVVKVRPGTYSFHVGGDAQGSVRLELADGVHDLDLPDVQTTFFPGGVVHEVTVAGVRVELLQGALPEVPYLVAVRVSGTTPAMTLVVAGTGEPRLAPSGRIEIEGQLRGDRYIGETVLAAGGLPPTAGWDELRAMLAAPYEDGLLLTTPSPLLDRAVPFSRQLLDLGFDGRLHVCELFRWRDVWSRDLGSGLVPGAMASGRFAAARATIDYDLARHAAADPRGLKVTQDPSQGGTAEGVAWLTRAVWADYLLTGDRVALDRAAGILRPWVEAWLARDADRAGLLVDVSEWMDHSRFFLFPDGARVLYSNVLFAGLLRRFGDIETELGNGTAAARWRGHADRFVRGINDGLWNERQGSYDNLELWGLRDERVTAAENALAVLCGVAPRERALRALATVRATNWRRAGSTTIYPPMTHVPDYIDHNFRMWPWWNAVEARARCRVDDPAAAVHLLECCSRTLADEQFPGLMEELTSPEGLTEGGHAFLTAAGSYLDAVVGGLLGVEIVEPGCRRLRVAPAMPADWRDWSACVPLPQGALELTMAGGRLRVAVSDPRVAVVEVPDGAEVTGAAAAPLTPATWPRLEDIAPAMPPPLPPPPPRRAAVLAVGTHRLTGPALSDAELAAADPSRVGAIVVPGNALPLTTAAGTDVRAALTRHLDRGGALVFHGATMHERGTMGEHGGVVDWYGERPVAQLAPVTGWTLRRSPAGPTVARGDEPGLRAGWQDGSTAGADPAWITVPVPGPWEAPLGGEYDGWAWYRARFALPAEARGRVVVLDLGRIDDRDWTYVNGHLVGALTDWQAIRRYRLRPGEPAYDALRFGGENLLSVQVLDTGGGGGLYIDQPRAGFETGTTALTPIDPKSGEVSGTPIRLGVVSWGPGGAFFNSWETSRGAFGFAIDGHGVEFVGRLAGLAPLDVDVAEAFTDFAVSLPWRFEPLAFTRTRRGLLVPDGGERYPCLARLVNTETGGEIVLIPASVARTPAGAEVLARLRIEGVR